MRVIYRMWECYLCAMSLLLEPITLKAKQINTSSSSFFHLCFLGWYFVFELFNAISIPGCKSLPGHMSIIKADIKKNLKKKSCIIFLFWPELHFSYLSHDKKFLPPSVFSNVTIDLISMRPFVLALLGLTTKGT